MSVDIKTSEWDYLISGKKLVAAIFAADYCPYCVRLKPIFESIAKDYKEIKFVKVNVQSGRLKGDKNGNIWTQQQKILSFCYFLHLYGHD